MLRDTRLPRPVAGCQKDPAGCRACVGEIVKCSFRSLRRRERGIVCHGGDRCTERSRSRAHGYDVGYQGEKERKNEKLTTKQLDHEGITLDEVRIK